MKNAVKVVRTDRELECPHIDRVLQEYGAELVLLPESIPEDELALAVQDADLLLMCYTPITEKVIASADRLKGIVKYGVGIDAIDIPAAKARDIPVVNIPEYAEETVAEGAFALMIALLKKLVPLQNAMQKDGWAWPETRWLASDIAGKTVGIVGLGRIGKSMARMAGAGFRTNVVAYDPTTPAGEMQALGVRKYDDLHEMLKVCDVVSVHAVLTKDSHHLIGAAELTCMKPDAILINVARGAIVDELALLEALKSGTIGGAALDVFSQEPLNTAGHPLRELFAMENVILSPHLTFYTHEAMHRLEIETLERCFEMLEDRPVLIKSRDSRLAGQAKGVET